MLAFKLFSLLDPTVTATQCKVHLASFNGQDDPLGVYLAGNFQEWQRWQTRKNFERKYVVSLIALPEKSKWLFAGVHASAGCKANESGQFYYNLTEVPAFKELDGRLVVHFERTGRQAYRLAETIAHVLPVSELKPEPMSIAAFPGYRAVDLSKAELDLVVAQANPSWRSALSSVAGVYLITDTLTGKLYVGKASGAEGGIWARWSEYSATGHGGNVELKKLMSDEGLPRASSFRFAILEIADLHESEEAILQREAHWKRVLLTRSHGLNAN